MSFNEALRTIDAYAERLNAQDAKALLEPLISLGMNQAHLAREVGVSETLVSLWLSGKRSMTVPQAMRVFSIVIYASVLSTHPDVQASIRTSIRNWLEVLRQRRSIFYRLCAVLAG